MRKQFITPQQLCDRWGAISPRTLANWRVIGQGPTFTKIGGRVLYHVADVQAWEESRRAGSTSEYGGEAFGVARAQHTPDQ